MGSVELVLRWPDSSMRSFNSEVLGAASQFIAALSYPEEGNLIEGSRHYELARRAYSQFRR